MRAGRFCTCWGLSEEKILHLTDDYETERKKKKKKFQPKHEEAQGRGEATSCVFFFFFIHIARKPNGLWHNKGKPPHTSDPPYKLKKSSTRSRSNITPFLQGTSIIKENTLGLFSDPDLEAEARSCSLSSMSKDIQIRTAVLRNIEPPPPSPGPSHTGI